MNITRALGLSWVLGLCAVWAGAAGVPDAGLLPNEGFERGTDRPEGWQAPPAGSEWAMAGLGGGRALVVRGTGSNSCAWRTAEFPMTPGGLYRLGFMGRRDAEASGGSAVSGTGLMNRDFRLEPDWRPYGFVFCAPQPVTHDYVRLGQWETRGALYFDNAQLRPVRGAHARFAGGRLGEAETIRAGVYRFDPNYRWEGANYHRPLVVNRCGFNSDRWTFGSGSEVVYRHEFGGLEQTGATVRVSVNYHVAGSLKVDASRDGVNWTPVGVFDGAARDGTRPLPGALFPATNILVRLSAAGAGANFQVNTYEYQAPMRPAPADAIGRTDLMEVLQETPGLAVDLEGVESEGEEADARTVVLRITARGARPEGLVFQLSVDGGAAGAGAPVAWTGESGQGRGTCRLERPGRHEITARLADAAGRVVFSGRVGVDASLLAEPRAGYYAGGGPGMGLWWCESGWKIGRGKRWPAAPANGQAVAVKISAAGGEYEAAQLFLSPQKDGQLLSARPGPFRLKGAVSGAVTARVDRIEHVRVTRATDWASTPGLYPDPLPPLEIPAALRAGENFGLWITVHAERGAAAGDYIGSVELETTLGRWTAPVEARIHGFDLPRETHLRSAFGLGTGEINQFHKLKTPAQRTAVYERYLANFAEHRISPYSFFEYAPIEVRFEEAGGEKRAKVDFTRFDAEAERWLDSGKFNGFVLPLKGMGGGTFQSRYLGKLEGFEEGTPGHARLFKDYLSQVEDHLRARGWLGKAYTYWFDEPDVKDYEFVAAGMDRIRAAAPGLRRMLTKQPAPVLMNHVDIWCGLTPEWTPERVRERRAAGEEVWWYICCAPEAPHITEFIDHPGTEPRLWPWMSWAYGVQGILVWSTTYWTSSSAFPGPEPQDPWLDPMSYVSGYDFKAGYIGYWGNGDGRYVYPPRQARQGPGPCLEGPVNSMRWELLRDGMEDYEYFWLLEKAAAAAQARGAKALAAEARALLRPPAGVLEDLTHFNTDPRPMLEHRARMARMIERLKAP